MLLLLSIMGSCFVHSGSASATQLGPNTLGLHPAAPIFCLILCFNLGAYKLVLWHAPNAMSSEGYQLSLNASCCDWVSTTYGWISWKKPSFCPPESLLFHSRHKPALSSPSPNTLSQSPANMYISYLLVGHSYCPTVPNASKYRLPALSQELTLRVCLCSQFWAWPGRSILPLIKEQ